MAKKIIKAQMKQRTDTKANWASSNPVLLKGELGLVDDDPNLYKVGDGATAWNALPFRGFNGTVVNETGTSETVVMSQKAVTEELTKLESMDTLSLIYNGEIEFLNGKLTFPAGSSFSVRQLKGLKMLYDFSFENETVYNFNLSSNPILVIDTDEETLSQRNIGTMKFSDIVLVHYNESSKRIVSGLLYQILRKENNDDIIYINSDIKLVSSSSISLSYIAVKRRQQGALMRYYVNEEQTEETIQFTASNSMLVLDNDNRIVMRGTFAEIRTSDSLLLSYASTSGFTGGLLRNKLVELGLAENIEQVEQDVKASIERISSYLSKDTQLDLDAEKEYKFYINAANVWAKSYGPQTSYIIDISQAIRVTIKANSDNSTTYAVLKTRTIAEGESPEFSENYTGRKSVPVGTEITIDTEGEDDNFLYIYNTGNEYVNYRPEYVIAMIPVNQATSDIDEQKILTFIRNEVSSLYNMLAKPTLSGRDIPQNTGVFNMARRAQQLKNVKWTALSPVPTHHDTGEYGIGVHYGIPYSSVKELDKFVGYNVSLRTFVTAANNPYSLLYTENVSKDRSRSGYGNVYNGTNCGSYYGIVCNIFTEYAIGMADPYNSYEWQYLEKQGVFEKIYEQDAQGVMLGDLIWEPGHCNIITDIYRDERGRISKIYWSESAGSVPVTWQYTPEEFNERLQSKGGIVYRYKDLYKNLQYVKSPFSKVDDELEESYVFNDDICTFAGDYACFREGEKIFINYTLGKYTSMEVYKNDELLHTYPLSPDADIHALNLSDIGLGYGKYKACLVTIDGERSDYTYWEILQTEVMCTYQDGIAEVQFNSENATPARVYICSSTGGGAATLALTEDDIRRGAVSFDLVELYESRLPNTALPNPVYLKVMFIGEYGVVSNAPLEVA